MLQTSGAQDPKAERLDQAWAGSASAMHILEYYRAPEGSRNVLEEAGLLGDDMPRDGLHDDPEITMNMMVDDPSSVRWAERVEAGQAVINGVSIADLSRALELGRAIAEARAEWTAEVIRDRISEGR